MTAIHPWVSMACTVAFGVGMFAVSLLFSSIASPLGGLIYAALTVPIVLPGIRHVYKYIITGPFRFSFLFKFVGFAISSSGVILPLFVIQIWWPYLLKLPSILWGSLAAAVIVSLNIMHRAHLMQVLTLEELIETFPKTAYIKRLYGFEFSDLQGRDRMQFARMNFSDIMAIDLLKLAVCYGLVQFCGSSLQIFSTSPLNIDSPAHGVESAFSFIRILNGTVYHIDGFFGYLVNSFFGLSILFFMTFFFSLTSRMVDEPPTPIKSADDTLAEIEAAIEGIVEKVTAEAASVAQQPEIKPIGNAAAQD